MKSSLTTVFVFISLLAVAQKGKPQLEQTIKKFHLAMLKQDTNAIKQCTDNALSYGHSNGWIQNKTTIVADFASGLISYQGYDTDSMTVAISGDAANVRYVVNVAATLKSNASTFHLKVLEVWIWRNKKWLLLGRQAVRG
ncbi:MAG: nuclear transport factor 2 family protein [Bacteroidetes bacterium]|nr:nuclear transport factor 2 family protein [Bacteroidota bacterium]